VCVCVKVHACACMALPTEPRESSHAIEPKRDRNVMLVIFLFPLSPSFSLSPPLYSVKNTMPLLTLSFPHRDPLRYLGHSEFECSLVKHIHSTKSPLTAHEGSYAGLGLYWKTQVTSSLLTGSKFRWM